MKCTLDQVVATINKMNHDNATILLADGSPIGAQQTSETCRGAFESASPGQSYDPISEELFLLAIQEK
eukprot:scaffold30_cov133-Chaetoceros_neogracile.AAC.1